jgi:hypothetical protein
MQLVFIPFMARDKFAAAVGITPDVLERWIRDGRVRTYRIGKRSLVDLRQWAADDTSSRPRVQTGERAGGGA